MSKSSFIEVICPYCEKSAVLVKGDTIYPHRKDLYGLNFWYCPCQPAYVGCHKVSVKHGYCGNEPLGRLANSELRAWKSKAHTAFDPLWKSGKFKSRTKAYNWLSSSLNIPLESCHIGMFDVNECKKVVEVCKKFKQN